MLLNIVLGISFLFCIFNEKIFNFVEGLIAKYKKERFIHFFLYELNKKMGNYLYKETQLIFFFEIKNRRNELYDKLSIFNTTYPIQPNKPLRIKINRKDLIKSEFTDYVTLSNSNSSKSFLININLRQENYYQTFLDCSKNINTMNATEIVFYSKDNIIPNELKAGDLLIKNYEKEFIPRIKRFYVINIDVNDVKLFYNYYSSNKLDEQYSIQKDLFINLIKNNDNIIIGRLFEQKEEEPINDFDANEIEFLKKFENEVLTSKVFPFFKCHEGKMISNNIKDINDGYREFLSKHNDDDIKSKIIKKMDKICFFIKYHDKRPKMEEIKIIESIILLNFLDVNRIDKAYKYIKLKNKIFKNPFEFTLKEKLFISINIYLNIYKDIDANLMKLYSLPKESPYVQSEIKYRDLIMNLTYDSCLYFLYLQLNSNCDIDIISSNSWFKIKKIPLDEIRNHLLSDFSPYFFTFYSKSPTAFTNPQTLLKSFNENKGIGYTILDNFAETINLDNSIKLFYIKIHEGSHCKFKGGFNMRKSGRYLLNYDLKVIDCHYDSIKYDITQQNSKLGKNIGEEGYAAEIFIFGNYKTSDEVLSSSENLSSLSDIKLYTGPNFENLRKEISTKISGENTMILKENFENSKETKKEEEKKESDDTNEELGLMDIFLKSLDDGIY